MTDPPTLIQSLQELFAAEHRRFDELGLGLIAAVTASDDQTVQAAWDELRTLLLVHVDSEDRFLIPALTRRRSQEARALLAEHRLIRHRIVELDDAFSQDMRPLKTLRIFVDELNAHERHEARVLYAYFDLWLDENERALLVAYREEASKASRSSPFTGS